MAVAAKENKTLEHKVQASLLRAPGPKISADKTEKPKKQNMAARTTSTAKSANLSPNPDSTQFFVDKSRKASPTHRIIPKLEKNYSPNQTTTESRSATNSVSARREKNNTKKATPILIKTKRMSLQANRATIQNYSTSAAAPNLDDPPATDKKQGKNISGSKIGETLGLAVGGPLYSEAKELYALKDDHLVKKISGLLKGKNYPSQKKGEGEKKKAAKTNRAMSDAIVKTDEIVINADKLTLNADKTELLRLDSLARKETARIEPTNNVSRAKKESLSLDKDNPDKKPTANQDKDKSWSEQAQEDEKQKRESEALTQVIRIATLPKPSKTAQADKKPEKGLSGSRIGETLGLAVGGPLYSAAKELFALKDDPLAQKVITLIKNKIPKTPNKSGAKCAKTEIYAQNTSVQAEKKQKTPESPSKKHFPSRDKTSRSVKAQKSDGRKSADFDTEDETPGVEVEADRNRDIQKSRRKRARGKFRPRRRLGKRGSLTRRLGKTKAGKGLATSFNLVKSVAGNIGGMFSQSPLGETAVNFGGKIGKAMGKAGGVLGRIAGKAALPLNLATTAFDMAAGWSNAAKITGKDEKNLTVWDKLKASGAKAAEGLSFGLIPAETFFSDSKRIANAQKSINVNKTSFTSSFSDVMSGPAGADMKALMSQNPAAITAKPEAPQSLPSPVSGQKPTSAAVFKEKTPPLTSTPPPSVGVFQENNPAAQKLDIIIIELRELRKELNKTSSGGPGSLNDPFLRATIAEAERQFNTW